MTLPGNDAGEQNEDSGSGTGEMPEGMEGFEMPEGMDTGGFGMPGEGFEMPQGAGPDMPGGGFEMPQGAGPDMGGGRNGAN